jgi:hypothetical protein
MLMFHKGPALRLSMAVHGDEIDVRITNDRAFWSILSSGPGSGRASPEPMGSWFAVRLLSVQYGNGKGIIRGESSLARYLSG